MASHCFLFPCWNKKDGSHYQGPWVGWYYYGCSTYNLKLKLAFAIISISGVHALKTYLEGKMPSQDIVTTVVVHLLFVISAVGIAFSEYLTRKDLHKH